MNYAPVYVIPVLQACVAARHIQQAEVHPITTSLLSTRAQKINQRHVVIEFSVLSRETGTQSETSQQQ